MDDTIKKDESPVSIRKEKPYYSNHEDEKRYWLDLFKRKEESKLNTRKFCLLNNISVPAYYKHRKLLLGDDNNSLEVIKLEVNNKAIRNIPSLNIKIGKADIFISNYSKEDLKMLIEVANDNS